MHRDYQMIGLCQTALMQSGDSLAAADNTGDSKWDFVTVICLTPGIVSAVVQRYVHPKNSIASVSMAAGGVLYNVKTITFDSGDYQVIFHKS